MQRVIETARKVAPFDTTILITGESGTGKEVLAKFIHRNSRRKEGPFIAVNCSAIPENLLEAELFGYKKGSFSGAYADKKGIVEEAHKGTLFLDEIGDLSLPFSR
ncbi:MAG: sigma-54 factor interaction domain-containing protein [Aquificota bacterium]|nr:sigma-54 factor interaction domain-containing protein [Aquificota bacterium]